MKLLLSIVALAFVAFSQGRQAGLRSYAGYEVLTVTPQSEAQFHTLREIYNTGEFDFWLRPAVNGQADIMVSPEQKDILLPQLVGMKVSVKIANVADLIEEEQTSQKPRAASGKIETNRYNRYADIVDWLKTLPDLSNIVESVTEYGQSYEGKPLYVVKISSGGTAPKRALFIDANIHAREWITSATAVWLLNDIVTNPSEYTALLQKINIYIVPMVNPDGYEFCHTSDRMWRKTRKPNAGSTCIGCDPNRNFAFQFGGESTSANPCSDTFHGGSAFSQDETKAISELIVSLRQTEDIGAYISFHSYGQYWLLPWGYTSGVYPPDYQENLALGTAAAAALRAVSGTRYEVGQGADVLYGVGGASDDWAKSIGIPYTVTAEMRDTGSYGFQLPATQIQANAREVKEAVLVYAQKVADES